MSPLVLIHGTYEESIPGILREGIEPRDTTRHNFRSLTYSDNAGIEAVYATMLGHGSWSSDMYVLFDAAGLPTEPDPEMRMTLLSAVRVRERVEPDRIMAVLNERNMPIEWQDPRR